MAVNKGGRTALGNKKRNHRIALRFNNGELEELKNLMDSYHLDHTKRGVIGPFLRRLVLNKEADEDKKLPDLSANLVFQINKIGVNINQLTAAVRSKNLRNPSAKLEKGIEKSNELLTEIMTLLNQKIQ